MSLTEADLAYWAGVLDTQAIIRLRPVGTTTVLPFVGLHRPVDQAMQQLARVTGTRITVVRRDFDRASCVEHCPERHQHVVSESGRWSISGSRATVVLVAVRPYLRIQGFTADMAIQAGLKAPRKKAVAAKMTKLGWPLPPDWARSELTVVT